MSETIEVLITLNLPEALLNQLKAISPRLNVNQFPARAVEEVPAEYLQRAEVLYTTRVLPTPAQAPMLRWIQFHWAGMDHALQAPILSHPDLIVTSLSGASAPQMAEFAVMMLLALGHHLPALMACQEKVEWPSNRWQRFNPVELRSRTAGIVGYGSVGRQAARLLHTFGATLLATKRDAMHPEDKGYSLRDLGDPGGDFVHRLYPPQALRAMLKECDFILVTVPLTPETRGLIGAAELAAVKPGAYLVDISRGGVIDHSALIAALQDGRLAGAALDVYPEEPLPASSILWDLPNVILTPHIAGFSPHYDERAVALFAENLNRYLANLPLHNRLNLERGY